MIYNKNQNIFSNKLKYISLKVWRSPYLLHQLPPRATKDICSPLKYGPATQPMISYVLNACKINVSPTTFLYPGQNTLVVTIPFYVSLLKFLLLLHNTQMWTFNLLPLYSMLYSTIQIIYSVWILVFLILLQKPIPLKYS